MRNTIPYTLASIMILASMLLVGCDASDASNTEVVSPTGCLKSQGRYYDPKLKECVQVDDKHQARVLNEYRYVNQLAEEGKVEEAEYLIVLKYATVPRTEELWSYLRERGTELRYTAAFLPTQVYDDSPYKEATANGAKVWGARGNMEICSWDYRFHERPVNQTMKNFIEAGIEAREKKTQQPFTDVRKSVFEDGDCRVAELSVIANPAVIRDFWNAYLNDIEAIQPQVTSVDTAQGTLGPSKPLVEGE